MEGIPLSAFLAPMLAIVLSHLFNFRADWSLEMLFPLKQIVSSLQHLIITNSSIQKNLPRT